MTARRLLVSLALTVTGLAAAPGLARAENVTRDAAAGALALGPDGGPRVAYVAGRELELATRAAAGTWTSERAAVLPNARGVVVGLAVDRLGRSTILAEDDDRRWLTLSTQTAAGWRTALVVSHLPAGALLGNAGLALDRRAAPVVAYAFRVRSGGTFLRLVRPDAAGRLRTRGITRKGFPPSLLPPSAAPVVLPNGVVRVVEAYGGSGGAAIEWRPTGNDWTGKFLFSSPIGLPVGPIAAAAGTDGTVYAAWTVFYGGLGELDVVLGTHADRARSGIALRHAELAALALTAAGPEIGANDRLSLAENETLFAGLVASPSGQTVELDGRLLGLGAPADGSRQLLLAGPDGLSWFRSPGPLARSVALDATSLPDGSVALSGRVDGAVGGTLSLYRERPGGLHELVATPTLAPDGSFSASDAPPSRPVTYRAVYTDAATGIPYAALLRTPIP